MKKRGDITTGTVVTLILLVLAAIVLFAVISVFNSGMAGSVQDVVCAFSVRLSHKSQIIASSFSVFPMACYEKKIELIEGTKDEVMGKIADLMATCWWMYGEGKFESVKGRPLKLGTDVIYNCYVVDNVKIKDKESITYDGFYEFLISKECDKGKGVSSYYDYFEGVSEGNKQICLDKRMVDSYPGFTKDAPLFTDGKPIYIKFYDDDDKTRDLVTTLVTTGTIPGFIINKLNFGTNVDKIIISDDKKIKTKECIFL